MDTESKRKLKAEAHALKPVVMVGQAGLTDAVMAEIDIALNCHELIKIKIRADKDERSRIGDAICGQTEATLIQTIGQITVIYRKKPALPVKAKPPRSLPKKSKATRTTKQKPIKNRGSYRG
ncbi:hypothetical protein MCAMS1_00580 [biofilm metagenome]